MGVVDQQLLKTANRKQQNTDSVLSFVENCDIKLKILDKSTHLNQSVTQITVVSESFYCEGFSFVHVIITTIIISITKCFVHFQLVFLVRSCHDSWDDIMWRIDINENCVFLENLTFSLAKLNVWSRPAMTVKQIQTRMLGQGQP